MARFIVTAKKQTRAEIDDACLDIGSRSTCALTLDDPIVAQRHCELQCAEGEFYVRDLESATGTYLNGLKVIDPLPLKSGDVVIVGASRLNVTREDAEGGPLLRIELQEKQFLQKAGQSKDKRDEWVIGDREAWREAEVSFSRFPLLWNTVWGAAAVSIVVCVLFLFGGFRDKLTEPGKLHAEHARLFAQVAAGDTAGVPQNRIDAAKLGCGACHDQFQRVTMKKCYACHGELESHHPMRPEADPDPKWHWPAHACGQCHLEHEATPEGSPSFIPNVDVIAERCANCHGDSKLDVAGALELVRKNPVTTPRNEFTEPLPYNTFSHRQHIESGIKECKTCHVRGTDATDETRARGRREFARVEFAQCMACHHAEGNGGYVVSALNADWAQKATDLAVKWHGARKEPENCLQCHDKIFDKSLRKSAGKEVLAQGADGEWRRAASDAPKLLFSLRARSHKSELAAAHAVQNAACSKCHVREGWVEEAAERVGVFWHRLHMADLAGDGAALSSECLHCHTERATSGKLAVDYYRGETAACANCHKNEAANVPVLAEARLQAGGERSRVDFPHDKHMNFAHPKIAQGCLSCHAFAGSGKTAFDAVPTTADTIKDCSACHDSSHAEVGGGSCEACHLEADPVYRMAVADPKWPVQRKRPPPSRFSHYSRGHADSTEQDCGQCHDKIETRNRIDEIELPQENSVLCLKCHVEKKQRFHWR